MRTLERAARLVSLLIRSSSMAPDPACVYRLFLQASQATCMCRPYSCTPQQWTPCALAPKHSMPSGSTMEHIQSLKKKTSDAWCSIWDCWYCGMSETVPCCLCALCILSCLPWGFGTAGGRQAQVLQHLLERALEAGRPGKAHRTALQLGRP